jgi:glycosyltransferase involved in cell wall biosynthesis
MQVVLSTISEFHVYHVARELHRRGVLTQMFTGQPRWRLKNKNLPLDLVSSYPVLQTCFEGLSRIDVPSYPFKTELHLACHRTLDTYVSTHLPECDIFDALSYNGLVSGRRAQQRGARWICRMANSHMGFQDRILREEYERVGVAYSGEDVRFLAYAEESYRNADIILAQSSFARQTFIEYGVDPEKVVVLPTTPQRVLSKALPARVYPDNNEFRVLYVGQLSIRKGIHDLVQAFRLAAIPNSKLQLIGASTPETRHLLESHTDSTIEIIGVLSKHELVNYYTSANVFVLASVEEGMPGVLCESLSYGCPIIATENTGARDLFTDSIEGFIVPIHSPEIIAARLTWLYEHPDECYAMGIAAQVRAEQQGSWEQYGERLLNIYHSFT